jgi:serine protease Do
MPLSDLSDLLTRIAAQQGSAVVGLGGGWGAGSGIVVADGLVVTNAHNVRAADVAVVFGDGRQAGGTVAGVDRDGDLAAIRVDTAGVTPLTWSAPAGDDGQPPVGSVVVALANPGGRGLRVTFGTISARAQAFRGPRGRRIAGGVEHTAPLRRGSSGGPIVDTEGRLVGINTHRLDDGFYLALPADATLRARVDALAAGEAPRRVRLGVSLAPPHVARHLRSAVGLPERDGVLVRGVAAGGAAHRAGVDNGDLIVQAGGNDLGSSDVLFAALEQVGPGDHLVLGIVRGAEELTVEVAFTEADLVE